jgi:hypothetical protein
MRYAILSKPYLNFGHIKIRKEQEDKYHFISDIIYSNNRILSNLTINLIPK